MPQLPGDDAIVVCGATQSQAILDTINAAADAYRGVIPNDRWHEPYMLSAELNNEIAAGVRFSGVERAGSLLGVMGLQSVQDVDLIRHAYVLPAHQGEGIGTRLLRHICAGSSRRFLVGTWAAAIWAIAFYEKQDFKLLDRDSIRTVLRQYWNIPDRQVETSVVLERDHTQAGRSAA